MLDAERSQFSAEDALLRESKCNVARNYVALAKALGGGWDGAIDSSKPERVHTDTGPQLVEGR